LGKYKKELFPEIDAKIGFQNVDKVSRSTSCTQKLKFERNGNQYEFNVLRLDVVSRAK